MDSRKCAVRQTRCLVQLANQVSSGASTQVPVWSFFECTTAKLLISLSYNICLFFDVDEAGENAHKAFVK